MESATRTGSFVSVLDWATKYLDHSQKKHSAKVYDEKQGVFSRLVQFDQVDPHGPVEQIHPGLALEHLEGQRDTVLMVKKGGKMAPRDRARGGNAANKDRKNLSAGWNWGRRFIQGFPLGPNPWEIAPPLPEVRSPRYVPPVDDFWTVVDMLAESGEIAHQQDRVMLLTALHTAGRRNEIFNLKLFDREPGRIRLWTRKRKGGNLEENWIPQTPKLKSVLDEWIKVRPVDSESLFVILKTITNGQHIYGQPFGNRQHFMGRICKKAKVKPFGFHSIRHLSASVLWNDGIDIKDIQLILRHKSQATTERYLHRLGLLNPTGDRIGRALERNGNVIILPTASNG